MRTRDGQDWQTDFYKGMEVHVTALPHANDPQRWDYSVRIAQPAEDAGTASDLTASAGDDADYPTPEAAVAAGFEKGYAMVDRLLS
ncbi:hypothetical protein E4K72_12565 [Oxalobacteraceae bacterium OM1]|nr:hypothetical protein E4K72_12565 [Oxalobacteraceae bacterium OM1]